MVFVTIILCCVLWTCVPLAAADTPQKPSGAEARLKTLDPFYKKHVDVDGLLIVSSEKVSQYARDEAAYLVRKMLATRPDALATLGKTYVCVMAHNEMTTDMPECRGMSPWWDKRARGLGGRPIIVAEENLLCFKGDPYRGESIFVHEFAHGIHGAFAQMDDQFEPRLRKLHQKAKEGGRIRGYGMNSFGEFFAEGVQSWFHCNRAGGLEAFGSDGKRICQIHTREQMKTHVPELAKFIDERFRGSKWVYVPIHERLDQPHLQSYDPAKAPTFRWPPKVIEAYKRIEAEDAKRKAKKKQ